MFTAAMLDEFDLSSGYKASPTPFVVLSYADWRALYRHKLKYTNPHKENAKMFDDLEIPSEVLDTVQTGFALVEPQDAAIKGDIKSPGNGIATWGQIFLIESSKVTQDEQDADTRIVEITYQVAPDAMRSYGPDPNAGRDLKQFYRITGAALGDKNHKKRGKTMFDLAKLKSLAGAIGFDTQGQGLKLGVFFNGQEDGTPAFVVGKTVSTVAKNSWYEGKKRTEITDFIPLSVS